MQTRRRTTPGQETALARKPRPMLPEGMTAKDPSSLQRVDRGQGAAQTISEAFDELEGLSAAPSAPVVNLPVPQAPRAFELLARQPISLVGMTPSERDAVVVTAVADDAGCEHVVSRFGDRVWDLASEVEVKNRKAAQLRIVWPDNVPKALVDDAKAALYCALRRGPYGRKWSGSSVIQPGQKAVPTLGHLMQLGLSDFSQLQALHLVDHIADLRRKLQPQSVLGRLQIVGLIWSFHMDVLHPLKEHPWAGLTIWDAAPARLSSFCARCCALSSPTARPVSTRPTCCSDSGTPTRSQATASNARRSGMQCCTCCRSPRACAIRRARASPMDAGVSRSAME